MVDKKRLIAYLALVGGGVGGIVLAKDKKIALVGFALYAIHGALGLVEIITQNADFEEVNREYTIILSDALCQGLITTDYCIAAGLDLPKSLCLNIICPVIHLFNVYLIKNQDLLFIGDLGHAISSIACAYYGFQKNEYMAYIVAILFIIIHFARLGIYESWILSGINSFFAGMLLSGKDFQWIFGK